MVAAVFLTLNEWKYVKSQWLTLCDKICDNCCHWVQLKWVVFEYVFKQKENCVRRLYLDWIALACALAYSSCRSCWSLSCWFRFVQLRILRSRVSAATSVYFPTRAGAFLLLVCSFLSPQFCSLPFCASRTWPCKHQLRFDWIQDDRTDCWPEFVSWWIHIVM